MGQQACGSIRTRPDTTRGKKDEEQGNHSQTAVCLSRPAGLEWLSTGRPDVDPRGLPRAKETYRGWRPGDDGDLQGARGRRALQAVARK